MSESVHLTGGLSNISAINSALWFQMGANAVLMSELADTNAKVTYRSPGTITRLHAYVPTNSRSTGCTIKSYKNGSDGNLTISVPATTTGAFEDTTNSDSISAADTLAYHLTRTNATAGTSLDIATLSVWFDATTDTVTRHLVNRNGIAISFSDTRYLGYSGGATTSTVIASTETDASVELLGAMTFRNGAIRVSANTANGSRTATLRKNEGSTSHTISIPSTTTGTFENTANDVSGVTGDRIAWEIGSGGSSGFTTLEWLAVDAVSTNSNWTRHSYGAVTGNGTTIASGTTRYVQISGAIDQNTTESAIQQYARIAHIITGFSVKIAAITAGTGSVTFTLRKGGSATALDVTRNAGSAAGWYSDSGSVSMAASDLLSMEIVNSTNQTVTLRQVQIMFNGNQSPLVDAGPDQTITLPTHVVSLSSTESDPDAGPSALSGTWSVTSSPGGGSVSFSSTTTADTIATLAAGISGTYVIRRTVTDGEATVYDELTITVNAQPGGPPAPDVELTIDSVEIEFLVETLQIVAAANARDTLEAQVYRSSISSVFDQNVEVIVEIDNVRHFGGILNAPVYRGFGGIGMAPLNLLVQAIDFNGYADFRVITEDIPFGTATGELIGIGTSDATNPATLHTVAAHGLTTGDSVIVADHQLAYSEAVKAWAFIAIEENFSNNDTVVIGSRTYTMESAFSDTADKVLIGASALDSRNNLRKAINAESGAGSVYGTGTTANASADAIDFGTGLKIQADTAGTAGNSIAISESHSGDLIRVFWEGNTATSTLLGGSAASGGSSGPSPLNDTWVVTVVDANTITVPFNNTQAGYGGTLRKAFVLKDLITDALTYLADKGITLHASQADGPAVAGRKVSFETVREFFDALSNETGWIWEIDYFKVFRMWEPGSIPAPFNISDGQEGNAIGDLTVEFEHDYANAVIVVAGGEGAGEVVTDEVVEDGAAPASGTLKQYQFRYQAWDDYQGIWPNVLLISGVNYGPVNYGMPSGFFSWGWDHLTNSLWHEESMTPRPATGSVISATYRSRYPIVVTALDQDEIDNHPAGRIDKKITDTSIKAIDVANALAQEELGHAIEQPRTVRYTTEFYGLKPGQVQHITSTIRDIDADFLITEVITVNDESNAIRYRVTAVEGTKFRGSWRDIYKNWNR